MLTLLIARFDADPHSVTEILGLTPTSVQRRGEVRPTGRPYDFNAWNLELHEDPIVGGRQHDDAISRLVAQLKGREHRFAELVMTVRPASLSIYGGYYVSGDQQGIWLDPDQMAVLAACGIGWSLDLHEASMLS